MTMRLLCLLACISPLVTSDMCVLCQPGKYQTSLSNRPCFVCAANTFAPNAGMTACLECGPNSATAPGSASCACLPGYVWNNGTFACVRSCGAGFAANATGDCVAIGAAAAVQNFEITLAVPASMPSSEVEGGMRLALSGALGVAADRVVVKVVALPDKSVNVSSRRLLQAATVRNYLVEVQVLFPPATSAEEIRATNQKLASLDGASLAQAMQSVPNAKITVLGSTLKEAAPSSPPNAAPTPSTAAPTPSTATPTPSAPPPPEGGGGGVAGIAAGAGAGGVVVLLLLACAIKRKPKSHNDPT